MGGVLYGGGRGALGDLVYGEIVGMADWGEEILEEEGMGGYGGGKWPLLPTILVPCRQSRTWRQQSLLVWIGYLMVQVLIFNNLGSTISEIYLGISCST